MYTSPGGQARVRGSWLRDVIQDFVEDLNCQQFKSSTLKICCRRLLGFAEFTAARDVHQVAALPGWIDAYIAQLRARDTSRHAAFLTLRRFMRFLQQKQLIPNSEPVHSSVPHATCLDEYLLYLRERRGLCFETLELVRAPCNALLGFIGTESIQDLTAVTPGVVTRFITHEGEHYTRATLQGRCSRLRGFLSYLYRRDIVSVDLSAAVLAPRVFQDEQCPRFLTRAEIDAVLAVIDRETITGRRDFAMICLLAVYGLRGIEVIRLRLDDIDWRRQLFCIRRRKAGNSTTYPLSSFVGNAIVAYLQDGRPESSHRFVFLTAMAPFTPLSSTDALIARVKRYLDKAGVRVIRPGTHSFRYSCAQRLFEQDLPVKTIGDYLGHRDTTVTQRYTKIALEQLRDVAISAGEVLL
jgi:site-specific recombinase XerD